GINRRAAREAVFVSLQNLEDFRIVWVRSEGLLQGPADFLRDGALDAHAFDEKVILLILLDWVLRCKAVKMVVPDSVGNQLVPRGKTVVRRVDEEVTRVHRFLRPLLARAPILTSGSLPGSLVNHFSANHS